MIKDEEVKISVEKLGDTNSCKVVIHIEDSEGVLFHVEVPTELLVTGYLIEEALQRMGSGQIMQFIEDYAKFGR